MQASNSWTRDNAVGNNFLANSGTELNVTSSLYDLEFRNFDPVLGRMNGVDMMADIFSSHTPYNFSFNNPVLMSDPSGAIPCTMCDTNNGPYTNVNDGGSNDGITMNGQGPIRDMYGNSVWLGNSVSYDMYNNALAGFGGADGISIYGRALSSYDRNSRGEYGVWIREDVDTNLSEIRGSKLAQVTVQERMGGFGWQ